MEQSDLNGTEKKTKAYRITFAICFAFLIISVVPLAFWLLFAEMASGLPTPHAILFRRYLLLGEIAAAVTYFKWPWFAAIVGWIDLAMVLRGVFPWEEPGIETLFYQFSFDLLFFLAAILGLISFLAWKRSQRLASAPP
jgi:hypothetical protein